MNDKDTAAFSSFIAKAQKIARETNVELPKNYYRFAFHTCWKCQKEMIVFAWPKDGDCDEKAPKIIPQPKTVKKDYSLTAGKEYWVNTCPYCQSIQGDNYLYSEPEGPFFGIHCEEDSPAAFDNDMRKIANYAKYIGNLKD